MNPDFRAIAAALRQASPVVVDRPPAIRHFLLQRYFDMSIRNGRLGLISAALLVFGLAYEAPLGPRLVLFALLAAVFLTRAALAARLERALDPADPRSGVLHDLLLLIGSSSWSFLPFVMQGQVSDLSLFGIVYGAFVSVAMMSVSYHSALPATALLVTASFLPLVAFMAWQRTPVFLVLAVATVVCVAALMSRVLASHRTLLHSLAAERENALLVRELQHYRNQLETENASLGSSLRDASQAASRDALTGLHNRRYLDAYAATLAEAARAQREDIAVCMIDIDHFKHINDAHGHAIGDAVLRATAQMLGTRLRDGDCLARVGGEEFVAVLRRCDVNRARRVAEALRDHVAGVDVEAEVGPVGLTISLGVAQWGADESFDAVVERADRALYHAKRGGRDRVEIDPADALRLSAGAFESTYPTPLH